MIDDKKSTDPGLSAAERKTLRGHEAQEAIADHEAVQKAFHENRERLREERLVREATDGPMIAPAPELPDDTPIERVLFSTRIQNALRAAPENPRRGALNIGRDADQPPRFWKGLTLRSPQEIGPSVDRWG